MHNKYNIFQTLDNMAVLGMQYLYIQPCLYYQVRKNVYYTCNIS